MNIVTVPKQFTKGDELIIISRKEYENLLHTKNKEIQEAVKEQDILRWSQEAKELKKVGKLPLFKNLAKRAYPDLARKHKI